MGIDTHALHLLRRAHERHGPLGKTVTLGRQAVHLQAPEILRWLGGDLALQGGYCETMLQRHFGATVVDSIDNSDYEQATVVFDMNVPVPDEMAGQYDTVLDFGCAEHIFDVAQTMRNVIALTRLGGTILHVLPANGFCGHGFYQFSAEFFFSCYHERNGFADTEVYFADLRDPGHWYRAAPPRDGKRINIRSPHEVYVLAITRRVEAKPLVIQQSDYLYVWERGAEAESKPQARSGARGLRDKLLRLPAGRSLVQALDAVFADQAHRPLRGHPALSRVSTTSFQVG